MLTPAQIKEMVKGAAKNEFPSLAKALGLKMSDYTDPTKLDDYIDKILKNFDVEIGSF